MYKLYAINSLVSNALKYQIEEENNRLIPRWLFCETQTPIMFMGNINFTGQMSYDDKIIPNWLFQTEEEKKRRAYLMGYKTK